jgi:hypothetical protein
MNCVQGQRRTRDTALVRAQHSSFVLVLHLQFCTYRHVFHDRLGPRPEARVGRHRQRCRGQTRLIHGLVPSPAPPLAHLVVSAPSSSIPGEIQVHLESTPTGSSRCAANAQAADAANAERFGCSKPRPPPRASPQRSPASASTASPPSTGRRRAQDRLGASAAMVSGTWSGTARSRGARPAPTLLPPGSAATGFAAVSAHR